MDLNDNGKRDWLRGVLREFYVFVVVMTIFLVLCCTGCSSAKPVVQTQHDTTYVERTRVDSILQRDSVYLETFVKGDTVYKTKLVDRWRDRVSIRHDTVYATRTDSIRVPAAAERKASKWEQTLVTAIYRLLAVAAIVIAGLIWLRHRKV